MNKKIKLLTIALASFVLAGCVNTNEDKGHPHVFSDEWSSTSDEHFHKCTVEGCEEKSSREAHNYGNDGKCRVCGYFNESKVNNIIEYVGTKDGHYAITNGVMGELEAHTIVPLEGDKNHAPVEATCELPGKTYKQCSICKRIVEEQTPALGHSYGEWYLTKTPTETENGIKSRTCSRCQKVETAVVEKGDFHVHTYNTDWDYNESKHWHSANCGHDEKKDEASHSFGPWEIVTPATETSDGAKARTCSTCGYSQTETIPATGPVSTAFTFNSDITTPQKIHTTDQENFLNYSGEYYNITSSQLNSYNAKGNAENSFPNQITITWNYTAPSGKTVKNFSIVTGQEQDLSDGYTITGTTNKSISFYNPFLGTNYFKVIANFTDNTSEHSAIKTFLVDETAPRNVKIDTMSNCRDMGGRTTYAGGKIKQGMIYRTAETGDNPSSAIKEEMLNRFKVKTEIYVKDGGGSSSPLGSSVKYYNCSMDWGATPYSNLTRNAERLRKVFLVLGDVNNYPLFYHCRIGTDRTGICGVAINGLLGVPFNEVIQDYAFSNFGKIDGQRYPHKTPDSNGDDIAKYIDEILAMPGKNFQEQVYYSLLSIGIPEQTLKNVIDIMTIGTKATLPTDIAVANGNNLVVDGGSRKAGSDYKDPDVYYQISGASQSVSTKYTLSEAKKISVLCYLGSTNSSDSTKLASGIDLKIDGTSKTIIDKTYFKAGFGSTQQAHRTGYMFNILGSYDLTAGEHTITIAGKNSDKFNVGGIILIGGAGTVAPGEGGSQGGNGNEGGNGGNETPVNETIVANWLVTADTNKNNVQTGSNDNGTYYKLADNTSYIEYKFNSTVAGKAYLKANAGTKAGNATSSHNLWYDESKSSYKFTFTVNGTNIPFTDNSTTFADVGMGNDKSSGSASGSDSGDPVWVEFPEITIQTGENTIKIQRTSGYTLYFYEFKVVTR